MIIATHTARLGPQGELQSWAPWHAILDLVIDHYRRCPLEHGYPRFVCESFLDGGWVPFPDRTDLIPAMQNGTGILSYLKLHALRGGRDPWLLATARAMGDYLLDVAVSPDGGAWPRFPRSTARRGRFPQPAECGSQADRPFETEPDKGGIAGYALVLLNEASGESRYLERALHIARVLAGHQAPGDAAHSPWPFRVDVHSGAGRGPVSGNMSYILRLFDALAARGNAEFDAPRRALWSWISGCQIPSARSDGALFAQFFEDHDTPTNRTAWSPLNLARYLLQGGRQLTPSWLEDAAALTEFVRREFTHVEYGVRVCHEQDEDRGAWGGVNSTYGAVLALQARASGSEALARAARAVLDLVLYAVDAQGRPRDLLTHASPGGWQEDAHTDVIHNVVDALQAFPQWGD